MLDYGPLVQATMLKQPSGLIRLNLEVEGVPVILGTDLYGDEWRKACSVCGFSPVWFLGKFLLGGGYAAGRAFATRNQELGLFGGKVLVAPDLTGGPLTYSTSAAAFFRRGSLYRLVAGVKGSKKAASTFARRTSQMLQKTVGDPVLRTSGGAPVWRGDGDRLVLLQGTDVYLVHELTSV